MPEVAPQKPFHARHSGKASPVHSTGNASRTEQANIRGDSTGAEPLISGISER